MCDVLDMVSGLGQHWHDEDGQKMGTMDCVDVVEEVVILVGDIMRACEAVDIVLSSRIINSVNGARAVSTLTEVRYLIDLAQGQYQIGCENLSCNVMSVLPRNPHGKQLCLQECCLSCAPHTFGSNFLYCVTTLIGRPPMYPVAVVDMYTIVVIPYIGFILVWCDVM